MKPTLFSLKSICFGTLFSIAFLCIYQVLSGDEEAVTGLAIILFSISDFIFFILPVAVLAGLIFRRSWIKNVVSAFCIYLAFGLSLVIFEGDIKDLDKTLVLSIQGFGFYLTFFVPATAPYLIRKYETAFA
jgi:NADH:ubiquinone oxidoreductase subunit K